MASELTQKLIGLCHDLGREERGMAILGEGNASTRVDEETFLVKASGHCLQLVAVPFDLLKAGSRWVPAAPLAPTPPAAAAGRGAATSRGQGAERAFPRGRRRCGCRPTPAQSPPATWRRPATPASPTRCER